MHKHYLGDGVYIEITSPYEITLTTENGIEVTNTIVLEQATLANMIEYFYRVTSIVIELEKKDK